MKVKVTFKTLETLKSLILDSSNIEIQTDTIYLKKVSIDSFKKDEINRLANTCSISMSLFEDDTIRLYIHKSFCQVEFMPSEDDMVKYLTKQIDMLSAELNNIINK